MHQLTKLLTQKSLTIAVAESCTGGNLSALLTSKSGSSTYFDRGYITYSNHAKIDMLQVNPTTLDQFGAVSEPTALEMVQGVISNSTANIAVSITGIAGPTSDDTNKPVGMVCFGFCINGEYTVTTQNFGNIGRSNVVSKSIVFVVDFLVESLQSG